LGGKQETSVLSEQELYFFLNRSDKPKAIPFQKWIVSEVDSWRSYSLHP
ncbi:BRO family protein, partial [Candidatus Liberibacter asiaticus]